MAIATTLRYTVDLNASTMKATLSAPLVQGDRLAHKVVVGLMRGGAKADLTGATCEGYMVLCDQRTVLLMGEIKENEVSVTLSAPCYAVPGRVYLLIQLSSGETTYTPLYLSGNVVNGATGTIIDPEDVIPSLGDLLAQIEATKAAAALANAEAESANHAAAAADQAADDANQAAINAITATADAEAATQLALEAAQGADAGALAANTAAGAANQAAEDATEATEAATAATQDADDATQAASTATALAVTATKEANLATQGTKAATAQAQLAAAAIEGMTIAEVDLPSDVPGYAAISDVDGHKHIDLGLRQGKGYTILGQFDTLGGLMADVQNPKVGDQYYVGLVAPRNVLRWDGTGWVDDGKLQGAPGEAATLEVVETMTGEAGTAATMTETEASTPQHRRYMFTVPQGIKGDPGLTTSVNGVQQVEGNVQLAGTDIPSGVNPDWTVTDGLLAAKKTYVSFDTASDTNTKDRTVGDRWVIPSRNAKNKIWPNLFTNGNVNTAELPTGVTVTYEGTKITAAVVNSVIGAGFRFGNITMNPLGDLIATHKYYAAVMGAVYRTAASGTFEKQSVCDLNIGGLGTVGGAGINTEDGLPLMKANTKTRITSKVFTASRTTPIVLSFNFIFADTARLGTTISGTTYFELGDILLIDLTEIFGAGAEPTNSNVYDSLFLTGAWWGDGFPCELNMRTYFEKVQFGGKTAVCTEKENYGMWADIPLLTLPRPTYATAAAGFSFADGYPRYRRFGQFVYFEIQFTITTAMTAAQVKSLTTNAMLALPAMPGKFPCYSSVNTHQLFLHIARTEDNIVQLSLQSITAAVVNTVVTVNGMYMADDFSHDSRVV